MLTVCVGYKIECLVHIRAAAKEETDNVAIVKSKGPVAVVATVIATNKRPLRANFRHLCQAATERHKKRPRLLTERTCLETAFQSGYPVKRRRARASVWPVEPVRPRFLSRVFRVPHSLEPRCHGWRMDEG